MKRPIVVVIGTRPGAIKSIPVYLALKKRNLPVLLCATFQHDQMLQQVLDAFAVVPDINLNVMQHNQDLFYLTSTILQKMKEVFLSCDPQLVTVHGDTTTAFAAGMAAFYLKIPLVHLEAGLRTGNKHAPFPEEINRVFISHVATYHFAPTALNVGNLLREGVARESIFCVGNVVVDALNWMKESIKDGSIRIDLEIAALVREAKKRKQRLLLLTAHRRESFEDGLVRIFKTIKRFSQNYSDVIVVFPIHPSPWVKRAVVESGLDQLSSVRCLSPLSYKDLVYVMLSADLIITDSGGIQEEGVSLGKRVIVLRDVTERAEGIWEGLCVLTGTDEGRLYRALEQWTTMQGDFDRPSAVYGDGYASVRIANIVENLLVKDVVESLSV